MTQLTELSDPSELELYKNTGNPVVLIVYGANCVPCKQLKEYVTSELINQYSDVLFLTLNGTENRDWAVEKGIRTVPTTLIYTSDLNTQTVISGFTPATKEQFKTNLKRAISNV